MTSASPSSAVIESRLRAVAEVLAREGLDGYIATAPTNIFYLTGFRSELVSSYWRMLDTVCAVIATDRPTTPAIVVSDAERHTAAASGSSSQLFVYTSWMETRTLEEARIPDDSSARLVRPEQFWVEEQIKRLSEALEDQGVAGGRVGADLQFLSHAAMERIRSSAPNIELVDFTEAIYRLRSLKGSDEIEALRRSGKLMTAGIKGCAQGIRAGAVADDVLHAFRLAVRNAARELEIDGFSHSWAGVEVGSRYTGASRVSDSLLVKIDCGVAVDNLCGDSGRTFVFGKPTAETEAMFDVLRQAHTRARAELKPGRSCREVFAVAQAYVRSHGYPSYTRGHFGHSVGLDSFTEEPPFISVDEERVLEPGMVMAVEVPFYGLPSGSVQIEDLVLITQDGNELLTDLTTELLRT